MFHAEESSSLLATISAEQEGISYDAAIQSRTVRMNIALETLYLGVTFDTWKMICMIVVGLMGSVWFVVPWIKFRVWAPIERDHLT